MMLVSEHGDLSRYYVVFYLILNIQLADCDVRSAAARG